MPFEFFFQLRERFIQRVKLRLPPVLRLQRAAQLLRLFCRRSVRFFRLFEHTAVFPVLFGLRRGGGQSVDLPLGFFQSNLQLVVLRAILCKKLREEGRQLILGRKLPLVRKPDARGILIKRLSRFLALPVERKEIGLYTP